MLDVELSRKHGTSRRLLGCLMRWSLPLRLDCKYKTTRIDGEVTVEEVESEDSSKSGCSS